MARVTGTDDEGGNVLGLATGSVVGGRYTLSRAVAGGTEPQVWLAQDTTRDLQVTVVALSSSHPQAAAVIDAARRAAGIDNARLVRILDVGTEEGVSYLVEENLTGARSLTQLAAHGGLAAEEVRRLTGEAATALDAAGRRGLHHLGLTPDSLLRLPDGSVKLAGLATQAALAGQDHIGGERALRRDARGLVALAYAGLTGRWPYAGDVGLPSAPRTLGGVPRPSEIAVGVPADLDALCRLTLNDDLGPTSPGDYAAQIAPWSTLGIPALDTPPVQGQGDAPARAADPEYPTRLATLHQDRPVPPDRSAPQPGSPDPAEPAELEPGCTPVRWWAQEQAPPQPDHRWAPSQAPGLQGRPWWVRQELSPRQEAPRERWQAAEPQGRGPRERQQQAAREPWAGGAAAGAGGGAAGALAGGTGAAAVAGGAAGAAGRLAASLRERLGGRRAHRTGAGPRVYADPSEFPAEGQGAAPWPAAAERVTAPEVTRPREGTGSTAPRRPVPLPPQTPGRLLPDPAAAGSLSVAEGASAPVGATTAAGATTAVGLGEPGRGEPTLPVPRMAEPAPLQAPAPLLPPESGAAPSRAQSRFVLLLFAGLTIVALLLGVAGASHIGENSNIEAILGPDPTARMTSPSTSTSPTTSDTAGNEELFISGATGYDPEGVGGDENNDLGARVFDGDPGTFWQSEGYQGPRFGGLKSGVGLLVDMGTVVTPREITLTFPTPNSFELYLSGEPDRAGARAFGQHTMVSGNVTVTVPRGTTGRYLIVWFTDAPQVPDGRYRATLAEIQVRG